MKDKKYNKFNHKKRCMVALSSVFPSIETYKCFKDDGDNKFFKIDLLKLFIKFAFKMEIIPDETEIALQHFIKKNRVKSEMKNVVSISFESLIQTVLNLRSGRQFISKINELIHKEISDDKALKISISTLSRLKESPPDTRTKRNALRFIAFWIGFEHPDLVSSFNYDKLVHICPKEKNIKSNQGVRILFYLKERGEDITEKNIKWFKFELRSILKDTNINYATIGNSRGLKRTEFSLDLPLIINSIIHPGAFGRSVRDAVAISHQMSVRWTLSDYSSKRKALIIGISAGDFNDMNLYLKNLVRTAIPGEPMIRMTDFTRLCSLTNDVKIVFGKEPQISKIDTDEIINIWWIDELWNSIHWDFIPLLLSDDLLPTDDDSCEIFKQLLWNPNAILSDQKGLKAIITFYKFPHNTLLGVEIAKVLYFRGRFYLALQIIQLVLNVRPQHLTARSLKMRIMFELGHLDILPYTLSEYYFKIAEEEAEYINRNCVVDEEFFCEYVEGCLKKALRILRLIKHNGEFDKEKSEKIYLYDINKQLTKKNVYDLLIEMEKTIIKGVSCSSTGNRSTYYLACIKCLRVTLQDNENFFYNREITLFDINNVCKKAMQEMFFAMGWLTSLFNIEDQLDSLFNRLLHSAKIYDNSELLRSQQPSTKIVYAILFWDFFPIITIKIAKKVIQWLHEACVLSQKLVKYKLGTTSLARFSAETMSSNLFTYYVNKAIKEIEKRVGSIEELKKRDEDESLEDKIGGLKIIFLFFGAMISIEQYE